MNKLEKAQQRTDLSKYLIHLTKGDDSLAVLSKIISSLKIEPSLHFAITTYEKRGAACFYDCPIEIIKDVIRTSPNDRKPHGIMVPKDQFWNLGGRPAIYTDLSLPQEEIKIWPESQKYRLINTDLNRSQYPIDWMHEREWRSLGGLELGSFVTWKCLVETVEEAQSIYNKFGLPYLFYVLNENADYESLDFEYESEMKSRYEKEMRAAYEKEMRSYYE